MRFIYLQSFLLIPLAFWKPIFWPRALLMQSTWNIWTTLIGNHTGIIPVKFDQIPISGLSEDVVWSFPYIIQLLNCDPRGRVNFDPRGIIWTMLVEDLLIMLYTKYESSGPCSFRQEDFWKMHIENLFSDPVTYLCNQLEWFQQLW